MFCCRFSLVIRSTDNGSPPMKFEKTFTISVTDVNEKPTAIQVSMARKSTLTGNKIMELNKSEPVPARIVNIKPGPSENER